MTETRMHNAQSTATKRFSGVGRAMLVGLLAFGALRPQALLAQKTEERQLVTTVEADYPETLKRLFIGGTVRLEVVITPQGAVKSVTLLGGNPVLGQSAITAVKKWKYAPASSQTVTQITLAFDPHH